MAYQKGSGVIEKMARNQKAFKLEGNDDWYSVFKAVQMNGAKEGDSVAFDYEEKPKGGQVFRNIQGNVQITGSAPTTATASGAVVTNKDLHMTRGGAVKAAAELVAAMASHYEGDVETATDDLIAVAQRIEAYVLGAEEAE